MTDVVESKPKGRDGCLRELGYAMIYMRYLRPGFLDRDPGKAQLKRVRTLMLDVAIEWHRPDTDWWDSLYERITDEIENMC